MSKYPTDWLSKPLGKVYPKIVVGYVGNVNDHYCRAEEGVPFYRTLNIRDGYFRHSEHLYVTHEFNEKNKKSQITNNDILIARVGANLGMVCKANGISGLANMANAIIIKTNDVNSADADFYTSFLLSPMGKNQIYSGAAGGAQGVFNTKLTQEIIVPVPPLPEQRKIAKILSTWDKAITTTERLIASSQQQKKALMQQLLTGKKRLLNPETGMVFEGDWEEVKLKKLITKHSEKTEKNAQYPVLTSSRKGIYFQSDYYNDRDVASEDTTGYNVVPRGYFTYRHMSDDLVFKFNINTICDKGIVSTLYPVFSAKENAVVPYLLQAVLNEGAEFKRFSLSQKQGGSRTYMYLNKLNELKLRLPSLKEQQKIASVLTAADKDIELLQAKLARLKDEKKALMQQLLTGKRRVKVEHTEAT